MKSASRPPLRRLLTLDQMIRSGQYPNATTAAREMEVHPRTVHRDLEFLRDSWAAPLEYCPKHNGFYYTDADFALPLVRLTEGEVVALFLAERLMQEYADTPYAQSLAALFRKITLSLPEEVTVDLSHLQQVYSVRRQKTTSADVDLFRRLTKAIQKRRQLELLYWTASRNETTPRRVDPYHLVSVQGDWYLIAYCHLREGIRMFVPARIRRVKETGQSFTRPADFRIEEYLDHSFKAYRGEGKPQKVRLRFSPVLARYVREKQWHPSQKLQPQPDGSLIVSLQVNHLLEVKRWAMSYGSDCEVLAPAELRAEIRDDLERMKKMYE